tara:strand:+ start:123 stop:428 length:306 start_codon:yes stop_codon:yes gene_type:complete
MECLILAVLIFSFFLLGIGLGGVIENKRLRNNQEILSKVNETQEILLPLAEKFSHLEIEKQPMGTLVDYELKDPDETLEIPIFKKIQEEKWLSKNQKNLED